MSEGVTLLHDEVVGRVRLTVTARSPGSSRWAAGNMSIAVGDDAAVVAANRAALARSLGVDPARLRFVRQVHGSDVATAGDAPWAQAGEPEADVVLVDAPGWAGAVTAADCLPVLLFDPVAGLAAAAHVGRRGLVAGAAVAALRALHARGARRVSAFLGPAICGACYEVPGSMRADVERAAPGSAAVTRRGTPAVDIAAGVRHQLAAAGVHEVSGPACCTAEDPRLFSHRRDAPTGRFAAAVAVHPR